MRTVGSEFRSCFDNTGWCCDFRQNPAFLGLMLTCEQDEALRLWAQVMEGLQNYFIIAQAPGPGQVLCWVLSVQVLC